jgi:hypothetical protein
MEKLLSIKKITFFLIIFSILFTNAQNNFFVYKVNGSPELKVNDTLRAINKGTMIEKMSSLKLSENDELHLIDEIGDLFKVSEVGNYLFNDLQKLSPIKDKSSFTKKYFAYVWKQFTNNTGKNIKTGVVYRIDNITLMLQPADSIKIYFPEVKFSWNKEKDDKPLYFILKDKSSNQVTKIGTNNTSITLFIDNLLLKRGNFYEWTVTETKYPNFEEITFYSFELLDSKMFKALQEELSELTKDLKKLGFNDTEIKTMLCEDYKVCY